MKKTLQFTELHQRFRNEEARARQCGARKLLPLQQNTSTLAAATLYCSERKLSKLLNAIFSLNSGLQLLV